jgi:hypothetical protein
MAKVIKTGNTIQYNLDFYMDKSVMTVDYNSKTMPIMHFLDKNRYSESRVILNLIYGAIINDVSVEDSYIKYAVANNEPREQILLIFLIEKIIEEKKVVNIVIRKNSDVAITLRARSEH